jgi:RNA polymerase sigma factor (sigma-70 family)
MKPATMFDDNTLLALIGERQTLNEGIHAIYKQNAEPVQAFIMSKGGSEQDAEDVFQETVTAFIDIVQKGKFRGEASVRTFLMAISKNVWYNSIQKRSRSAERDKIFDRMAEKEELDISHHIAEREVKQELGALINQLGEACKKILIMFYYENLSMKEMVSNLPYENEQVVRNKKYKCLQQLAEIIKSKPAMVAQMNEFLK